MPAFTYPEQGEREPGNVYWQRVRAAGMPEPWEADKANPPGPITVEYEWSTRDSAGVGWLAKDEETARFRLEHSPSYTLHRRVRWVAVGDWEDVER